MKPKLSARNIVAIAVAGVVVWSAVAGPAANAQDADGQFPSFSVIVLESDDPEIDARQVYTSTTPGDDGQDKPVVFEIPAGKSLKIMKPSGAIETYAGPQSVKVADLMDSEYESATFTKFAQDIIDGNYNNSFLGRGLQQPTGATAPPAEAPAAQPLFDPNRIDWGDKK